MAQGVLPFKWEFEKKTTGMTALAGLPAYLDLIQVTGLTQSIQRHLKVRAGGPMRCFVTKAANPINP